MAVAVLQGRNILFGPVRHLEGFPCANCWKVLISSAGELQEGRVKKVMGGDLTKNDGALMACAIEQARM